MSRCTACKQWNITPVDPTTAKPKEGDTILLSEIVGEDVERIQSGPWDPCFGTALDGSYGLVTTSVTLIGGAPGAGKSTLALSLVDSICGSTGRECFYFGTETIASEIKYHAGRLGLKNPDKIRAPKTHGVPLAAVLATNPAAIVCDSITSLADADDDAAVALCVEFKKYAIENNTPIIVIDHVNKDLNFAGLMRLQHQVDTLIAFSQWDPDDVENDIRVMHTRKNRFGPVTKVFFKMTASGLLICDDPTKADEE